MEQFSGFKKGVNIGGWLSQCSHTKEHMDTFITKEDIKCIKEHGYDHVRVPVDYEVFVEEDGGFKEEGFCYIDRCINWCKEENLSMILDLHKTKGYTFDEPESAYKFFTDQELIEFFLIIWKELAKRYGEEECVAFELLNEIVPYDVAEKWNQIVEETVKEIRLITKTTYIIIGGVCYNSISTVPLLRFPKMNRLVANFHCYEPFFFTHQGAEWVDIIPKGFTMQYPKDFEKGKTYLAESIQELLKKKGVDCFGEVFFESLFEPAIAFAKENNVPLYCGEYGVIDKADLVSTRKWLHDIESVLDQQGIGHASWNYKGLNFGLKERELL